MPSLQLPNLDSSHAAAVEPAHRDSLEQSNFGTSAGPVTSHNLGQAYAQPSYEQPSYEQPSYEQPSYEQPSYEQPSYEQPSYEQPAFEQPADTSQGFDSQPYQPPGYESRNYAPAETDPSDDDPRATSQPVEQSDSHTPELPSWWSDDPVASDPVSEAYPTSADYDSVPSESPYDSTYQPELANAPEARAHDPYAQSPSRPKNWS